MPVLRKKMRQWLEEKINSNSIEGLTWIDKERTMFAIPWKHAARQGWELSKDACIFREWAIHTGKYVEGQAVDPKTWKANFRCAMNSLPDIEEVKNRSVNKGHMAARVYRMLPVKHRASLRKRGRGADTKRRLKVKIEKEDDTYSTSRSQTDYDSSSQGNRAGSVDSPGSADLIMDVPDFCLSVEIESDVFASYNDRFQVSPESSNDCSYDQIIKICEDMERESMMNLNFHQNLTCFSPSGSDSSADDIYMPHYTTLSTDIINIEDALWCS